MGSIDFVPWKQLIQGNSNDRNIIYLRRIFFAHFYTPWLVFRTLITKDYWRRSRRLPLLLHIFAPLYYCSSRSLLKGPRKNRSRRTGVKTGFKRKKKIQIHSKATGRGCGADKYRAAEYRSCEQDLTRKQTRQRERKRARGEHMDSAAKRRKRTRTNGRTDEQTPSLLSRLDRPGEDKHVSWFFFFPLSSSSIARLRSVSSLKARSMVALRRSGETLGGPVTVT